MINYNTQPHRFIYTFKSLALLTMLVLSLSANAQYTIKVDSLKFPAYYPPTCNNCNVDYNTVWYNDVEIDIVTRTGVVSGTPDCPNNKCPTIILTPGGGFAELLTGGLLNDKAEHNLNDTVTLAVSLAKKGYTVIVPKYNVADGFEKLVLTNMLLNCGSSAASKAKLEYYQLTAFHDFRKTLQLYLKNADTIAKYFIDTNKVVLAGFSAGGILTINTLFLESNEMPLSITNLPAVLQSTYTANVRTQFYPIPKLKGAMAFTAGTFYPQIMENNYTKNIPLYLLHGTCDNLISQDVGLVPYKCNLQNPVLNTDSVTKYNTIYGSSWLFKKLLLNNYPVRYDQVCYGGHGTVPAITGDNNYGSFKDNTWDEYVPCPTLKPNPTIQERDKYNLQLAYWNANKHKNFTDPVESRIIDFCNSVFANPRTFVTKFSGFEAEGPENCAGDTSNIIPITNLTFSGQTCFGNATFPKYAQLTGGNESVLYYWKFGGNSNKVYTTFTPILMLDSIPKSVELSGCVTTTDFCKTINSCNRNITVIVVNGCDTLTFNHQSSISLCSGTCCPTCTVNMRLGKANTEEETESALSADINSMMAIGDRQLKIDIAQDSRGELYLYNMQGALVAKLNQQLLEGTNSILLDAGKLLPQGVYIAHYKDNENGILLSTKIVLQ